MQKISIGSFPLIEMDPTNRKSIDSYLIKVLSDLISTNQMSSSIKDARTKYITPFSIVQGLKDYKNTNNTRQLGSIDRTNNQNDFDQKEKTLKTAFKHTKDLYRAVANDPFYRNNIFYPIYLEEPIKSDYGYKDYKYDFIVLSNDLVDNKILDEMHYDDNIMVIFMVLSSLIFPNTPMSQIGQDRASAQIRRVLSGFLDTCKTHDVNPIDALVQIIKISGNLKRGGRNVRSSGIMFKFGKNDSLGKDLSNLFDNRGEIKGAEFLLQLTQSRMADFFDERNEINKGFGQFGTNSFERQFAQSKTHEYGKILTMVDALIDFNKKNNIIKDIDDTSVSNIEGDGQQFDIKIDGVLNDLEVSYMPNFLSSLKDMSRQDLNNIRLNLENTFSNLNIFKNQTSKEGALEEQANIQRDNDVLRDAIVTAEAEINQLKNAREQIDINDTTTISEYDTMIALKEKEAGDQEATYRKNAARNQEIAQKINSYKTKEELIAMKANDIQTSLNINLELIQAQLLGVYGAFYTYFSNQDFLKELQNHFQKTYEIDDFKSSNIYGHVEMELGGLVSTIKQGYMDSVGDYLNRLNGGNIQPDFKRTVLDHAKIQIDNLDIEEKLIKSMYYKITLPVFKKNTSKSILESNKLKNLRTEKNPVLKRILNNTGLFKSFILSEQVLINVYDILHYIDTQKFLHGLINTPVSKVSNPQNKIHFVLQRFGLVQNPIFIIGRNNVWLNMPDYLSLTGKAILSSVRKDDLLSFSRINFAKELWSENLMFGGDGQTKKGKDLKRDIEGLQAKIREINNSITKENDGNKKKKLQNQLRNEEANLRRKEDQNEKERAKKRGNNFSSNIDTSKRFDVGPVKRAWREPGEQNYPDQYGNTGNPGYQNPRQNPYVDNSRQEIMNQREELQRVNQRDSYQPRQPSPQPQSQYIPDENSSALFNNDQIRDRINTINPNFNPERRY